MSAILTDYYASFVFFFFNDTATTEIYTLSLHDALPILDIVEAGRQRSLQQRLAGARVQIPPALRDPPLRVAISEGDADPARDRKSTRLNSSHANISYAVFCLKKKKKPLQS